jgi:hypothetical protein
MGIKNLVRLASSPTILANVETWYKKDYAGRSADYATAAQEGGTRTIRTTSPAYLIPFSTGPAAKLLTKCRKLTAAAGGNNVSGLVTELENITKLRVFSAIPTGFIVPNFDGFKRPARVTLILKNSTPGQTRTSRITKRTYGKVTTDSASQCFGSLETVTTKNDYEEIHADAKAAVGTTPGKSYKLTPEGSR